MKNHLSPEITQYRKPDRPIAPLILNRWSPRAMTGESIAEEELLSIFEAARFAPSSFNNQPWRFLYARRQTPYWESFYNLLVDYNKEWCAKAAVLGISISKTTFDHNGKPSRTHAFDTGAAWENLCLEGTSRGLVVHGMEGFDYQKAAALIPKDHEVHAMFAIGKRAAKETLSEALQKKEIPSGRKAVEQFAFEGKFPEGRG